MTKNNDIAAISTDHPAIFNLLAEQYLLNILTGSEFSSVERRFSHFKQSFIRCESPIEKMLCAILSSADISYFESSIPTKDGIYYTCQKQIGNYRVDFYIIHIKGDKKRHLVVECDGYQYHDLTKEQVLRDKKRDRHLASRGIHTLRFSGVEIYKNSLSCIEEIFSALLETKWSVDNG